MPPKSMSAIFILYTKGLILGILGCADEEVCSFRFLLAQVYKVPATCKAGAYYLFKKSCIGNNSVGAGRCEKTKIPCILSTR